MGESPFPLASRQPSRPTLYLILSSAFILRLLLFTRTQLPTSLHQRPELATPINGFKSLLEAHYLHNHPPTPIQPPSYTLSSSSSSYSHSHSQASVSAYHSGTIHHSPLLLPLLSHPLDVHLSSLRHASSQEWVTPILWSAFDLLSAYFLHSICTVTQNSKLIRQGVIWPWDRSRSNLIAFLYLFNPYTLASCLARSTSPIENLVFLTATFCAATARPLSMAISLSFSILLGLYPILFAPLFLLLCYRRAGENEWEMEATRLRHRSIEAKGNDGGRSRRRGFLSDRIRKRKRLALSVGLVTLPVSLVGGIILSRAIALNPANELSLPRAIAASIHEVDWRHGWEWAERVYGTIILASDHTPNLGMWWYFFMEIFEHFRSFFILTFNIHLASYSLPVLIKYRRDPLFGLTVLSGLVAVFKSYPTVADHSLFLGLLSLHGDIFQYMRYPLVSSLIYIYCTFLSPTLHHLWLSAGSGNANFYYAITLVWALGGGMLVLDAMWSWGRLQWELERPTPKSKVSNASSAADKNGGARLQVQDDGAQVAANGGQGAGGDSRHHDDEEEEEEEGKEGDRGYSSDESLRDAKRAERELFGEEQEEEDEETRTKRTRVETESANGGKGRRKEARTSVAEEGKASLVEEKTGKALGEEQSLDLSERIVVQI
ncbi:PIG-U-domain-containing protein [Violaceomyces palustris]|uniref:PIG-U-domain-containing protein n=1 Tax=Violaceomyces palustris TaxID=1673888 RepID=A0ACD0P2F1_9BASI|nr:PIG-U-domain-containing protein [Violaceomyces palustris]